MTWLFGLTLTRWLVNVQPQFCAVFSRNYNSFVWRKFEINLKRFRSKTIQKTGDIVRTGKISSAILILSNRFSDTRSCGRTILRIFNLFRSVLTSSSKRSSTVNEILLTVFECLRFRTAMILRPALCRGKIKNVHRKRYANITRSKNGRGSTILFGRLLTNKFVECLMICWGGESN